MSDINPFKCTFIFTRIYFTGVSDEVVRWDVVIYGGGTVVVTKSESNSMADYINVKAFCVFHWP